MSEHKTLADWLDTAVAGIQFGPDREAVRQELEAHLEDKTLDLQRIFPDMTQEEAQERALAGMGDAEEIKVELAKVHRPWLAWLWAAACGIYVLAAFALFVFALMIGIQMGDWEMREWVFGSPETAWSQEVLDRSEVLAPDKTRVFSDGCTLTMERAWLVNDPEGGWNVQAELLLRTPEFWVEDHNFIRKLSAVDGAGNRYPGGVPNDRDESWTQYLDYRRSPINPPMLTNPFEERYLVTVYDVDPDLEELRLEYDWLGRSFTMKITREEAGL